MDYVYSNHRLTFDPNGTPLVILAYEQWIDKELAFSLAKAVEVIEPLDAAAAFIRDGKTQVWTAQITTYSTEELDLTARVNAMQSHLTIAPLGKKPLLIEIQGVTGGHYWAFSSCFIKGHTPVREIESGRARWSRSYDIVATGLSYA